jgi:hypothetical protein
MASVIDTEIKQIIDTNFKRALDLIKTNTAVMDNMVKLLYLRETIYGEEIELLMNGMTADEVVEKLHPEPPPTPEPEPQITSENNEHAET